MIARLVAADLTSEPAVWSGALMVAAASAVSAVVPTILIRAGLASVGIASYALFAIAGTVIALAMIAIVIVVTSVMRATVEFRRQTYALWLTVGVLPAQVATIVLSQLAAVSVTGSAIGAAIGGLALPSLVRAALAGATGLGDLTLGVSLLDLGVVVGAVTIVVVVTALPAARRAAATPPLQLLRDHPPRSRARARWVLALALVALTIQMAVSLPSSVDSGGGAFLLMGAVSIAAVSLGGGRLVALCAALWMRAVPDSASVAFSLARARVTRNRDDAAAIIPFFVAIALPSTFFASAQVAAFARGDMVASGSIGATGLILGGPVLLAAVGGAASIVMAVRAGTRDALVLASMGAPAGTIRWVPLWVAVQVIVTAALLALAVTLLVQAVEVAALLASSVHARLSSDPRPLLAAGVSSMVLALIAVVVTWRAPKIGAGR